MTSPERLRPAVHLTAPDTWMNDPNGLLRHRGTWHAFYQNNPWGSDHRHLSWAHATSDNLLHWRDHGPAILEGDGVEIFSGSAVHDRWDTSALGADGTGDGPLIAVYTGASGPEHPVRGQRQAQHLAVSDDDGTTWTTHGSGPVLDRGSAHFRDPAVFWHERSQRWVMLAVEAQDGQLLIHTSGDLRQWRWASTFADPALVEIWECPDLVLLDAAGPEQWLLILSTNPGGPAGGSATWGMLGDFDGRSFSPSGGRWFLLDHGPDFYAAVSFSGVAGPPVVMGWASNWKYASRTPTAPWRGTMSLPRRLHPAPGGVAAAPVLPAAPVAADPSSGIDLDPERVHVLRLPLPDADRPLELVSPRRTELTLARGGDGLRMVRAETTGEDGQPLFGQMLASVPIPVAGHEDLVLVLDASIAELVIVPHGSEEVAGPTATMVYYPAPGPWRLRRSRGTSPR